MKGGRREDRIGEERVAVVVRRTTIRSML